MSVVPPATLRAEAAAALPRLLDDLATWVDIDSLAWGQRYAVVATCRILYTWSTARVASKSGALEWGLRSARCAVATAARAGPRRAGARVGSPSQAPAPGQAAAARAFTSYAVAWAEHH